MRTAILLSLLVLVTMVTATTVPRVGESADLSRLKQHLRGRLRYYQAMILNGFVHAMDGERLGTYVCMHSLDLIQYEMMIRLCVFL